MRRRPPAAPRPCVEHLEDRITPIAGDLLQTLANPAPALADQFGTSVAVNGTYVIVGAPFDDPGGVTDAGSVYVFNKATGALVTTIPNPEPAVGDRFGWSVAASPGADVIWVGAPFDDPGGVTDSGRIYAFFPATGGSPVAIIDNPSPAVGDLFGYSLASERFGSYLAIGAPGDDAGATDAGRAYLAGFTGGTLMPGGTVSNPSPNAGDRFGTAVAVTQFGEVIAGAPFDDPGGVTDAGTVYVYDHSVQAVTYVLNNPAPAAGDQFGSSLALGGNSMLAVVGAPFDDPGGVTDAGSAYVFDVDAYGGSETLGALVSTLNNPSPAAGDLFGASVAISDRVALVGAPQDDPGGVADAGSAYEFNAVTGQQLATLNNPTPAANDRFGVLAQYGDRGVVLAPFDDTGAADAGSAYVFDLNNPPTVRNDTVVVPKNGGPTQVLTTGNDTMMPDVGETLSVSAVTQGTSGGTVAITPGGWSVTYTPPANFTGTDTFTYTASDGKDGTAVGTVTVTVVRPPNAAPLAAVVGPAPDYFGFQAPPAVAVFGNRMAAGSSPGGPVGVFDTDTGAQVATLAPPSGASTGFGSAVATYGNLVVVGDWSGNRAYLFDATTGALLRTYTPSASPSNQWFGFAVAIDGNTVVVGDYEGNDSLGTGPSRPGRVYVFTTSGTLLRTIVNPTPGFTEEAFGSAVAVAGNTLVIGAYRDQPMGNLPLGQVYVYDLTTGNLVRTLNNPALGSYSLFGMSVGIAGNRIVVGARESAYLFDATTGARVAVLGDPTSTLTEWFGTAVAISGNRVLVGAYRDDTGATDAGAAYLFDATTGMFLRTIANPSPVANDQFGTSVAISGNRAVIGAPKGAALGAAGAAFSFDVNFPPTARDDALTLPEDNGPTAIDALANDTTTPDTGEFLNYLSVTQPAHGTATIGEAFIYYTPDPNYNGPDSFTYTITDLNGGTATATVFVTVTPVNDPPTANNDTLTVAEDSPATVVDVLANDTSAPDTGETLTVVSVTQPATGGSVTLSGGVVRFTPAANFNGSTLFGYTISDGNGGTAGATVTVTVTPVNDAPVATGTATLAPVPEDTPNPSGATVSDLFASHFSDATDQVTGGSSANTFAGVAVVGNAVTPAEGTWQYSANGTTWTAVGSPSDAAAVVVAPAGRLRFLPAADYNGTPGTLSVRLIDSSGGAVATGATANVSTNGGSTPYSAATVPLTTSITPVNDPPVVATNETTPLNYVENAGPVPVVPGLTVSDIDSPTLVSATVTLTGFVAGQDALAFTPGVGITGTFANGVLGLTGAATVAAYQQVLRSVTYANASDTPATGPRSVGIVVSDGQLLSAVATRSIVVIAVDDPPAVTTNAGLTLDEGSAATIGDTRLRASDPDTPPAQLVFTVTAAPAHGTLTKGGTPLAVGGTFTQADVTTGLLGYAHDGSETTADGFAFSVSDASQSVGPSTFAITIVPVNDPPVAVDDPVGTLEDTPGVWDVLANDTDPDGGPPSVTGVTQPAHGTATTDGATVTYTPAADYNGPDTFTYTVSDGRGGTATGSVIVTVTAVNDPPVLTTTAGAAGYTENAAPVTVDPGLTLTDVDGPAVTGAVVAFTGNFAAGQDVLGFTSVGAITGAYDPATGVLNLTGTDTLTNYQTALRSVTYWNSSDAPSGLPREVTFTASDGQLSATATRLVAVTPVNDAPTAADDSAVTPEDTAVTVAVLGNDTDAEGNSLAVTGVSQPAHGTVTVNAAGVTYTPAANYNGPDQFTYVVSDGQGGSATASVIVTVTALNDPPTATTDVFTVVGGGGATALPVLANDTSAPDAGETLTITAVTQPAADGTVVISGGGSGLSFTPTDRFNGPATFTYTVSDGNGGTATATVTVTVASGRPLVVGGPADGSVRVFPPQAAAGRFPGAASTLTPFGAISTELRTGVGDVDGDGFPDAVLVTGPGVPIRVAVVSGADDRSVLVAPFDPFGGDFTGGGFAAAADLDHDGRAEFVVTPDRGGGPRVSVFSLVGGAVVTRANFFGIDDPAFRGGARAALGDVNADGTPDVVVAAGFLGGPRVAVFDGTTALGGNPRRLLNDFFAFPGSDAVTLRNGAYAAVGDVDGDGFADLIFGGGPGGAPRVFVLSGQRIAAGDVQGAYASPVANFFVAGNAADRGGVRVAAGDADADGRAEIVVGSGEGSPANVRVYLGKDFTTPAEPGNFQDLAVFGGTALAGGVYVG
jgi:hypothetical protein